MKKYRKYEESLLESLKDPQEALAYLNAALMDEDQRVFLIALKDVLKAQGIEITAFAEESDLNRQNIYRMLSSTGNPRWNSLKALINTMGLEVKLAPRGK